MNKELIGLEDETAKTGESMIFAVENEAYVLIMTAGNEVFSVSLCFGRVYYYLRKLRTIM